MASVDRISEWLQAGKAYEVIVDGWTYICARHEALALRCQPVPYHVLSELYKSTGDYTFWAPFRGGSAAPWGTGHPTVNYHLVQSYLSMM